MIMSNRVKKDWKNIVSWNKGMSQHLGEKKKTNTGTKNSKKKY